MRRTRKIRTAFAVITLAWVVALAAPASAASTTTATIKGTVYAPNGTPAANICVYVFDASTMGYVGLAGTASNGTYTVGNLRAASYKVAFADCSGKGYVTQWYAGSPDATTGRAVAAPASGINATMQTAGISGTVYAPGGLPAPNMCVYVFNASTSGYVTLAGTAADGTYLVTNLAAGSYDLAFADCSGKGYLTQWYNASGSSTPQAVAVPAAGLTTTMKDGFEHARTSLGARATQPSNVLYVGDSVTSGFYAGTRAQRFPDLVRSTLQGSASSGIGYEAATGSEIGGMAYPTLWSSVGATPDLTHGLGRRALTLAAADSTASITVTSDRLWLLYSTGPSSGTLRVTIDGAVAATINTSSTTPVGGVKWDSGSLPLGTHTLSVSTLPGPGGVVTPVTIEGVTVFAGDTSAGVHEWEGGHAGYTAAAFTGTQPWEDAIATVAPDLVVVEFGINEALGGVSAADFQTQLATLVDLIHQRAPQASVAVLAMWAPAPLTEAQWKPYVDASRAAAAGHNAGFVDVDGAALASGTSPSILTTDGIHPSPTGEQLISSTLLRTMNVH